MAAIEKVLDNAPVETNGSILLPTNVGLYDTQVLTRLIVDSVSA